MLTKEINPVTNEPVTGYALVNGISMYYEIHGQGTPLVLIHGGGSTIQTTFGRFIPLLQNHFKLIAVELQAHGHTSDRDAPESFEQDADDVAALLDHLGITKAAILGFSNGGNTAMQIATRHSTLVDKLVIASSFYKREGMIPGFFEGMKNADIDMMPQALKDAFLAINPDRSKLLAMFNKDRERMLYFKDWNDDLLRSIAVPTLIINGDRDVVLANHAATMSELIPNSRLLVLPATHGAYIGAIEVPPADGKLLELTADTITSFLTRN